LARGVLAMPALNLALKLADLPLQVLEVVFEAAEQLAETAWQLVLAVFQNLGQMPADRSHTLRDHDPELAQQSADLIGLSRARLHADQPRRQVSEEGQHLRALELLLQRCLAALVHAMHLKHALCQIDASRRNLHFGRLLSCRWITLPRSHLGTSMPYREGGD